MYSGQPLHFLFLYTSLIHRHLLPPCSLGFATGKFAGGLRCMVQLQKAKERTRAIHKYLNICTPVSSVCWVPLVGPALGVQPQLRWLRVAPLNISCKRDMQKKKPIANCGETLKERARAWVESNKEHLSLWMVWSGQLLATAEVQGDLPC